MCIFPHPVSVRTSLLTLGIALLVLDWGVTQVPAAETISSTFVATAKMVRGSETSFPTTLLSLPAVRAVAYAGQVTSVGSGTISDIEANWADDEFNSSLSGGGTQVTHYVEFDSGLMADIEGTDAATQTLILAGHLTGAITEGDNYRIRPHSTINSIFGSANEAGLLGGTGPNNSDNVLLIQPNGKVIILWYSTISGFEGWMDFQYDPAGDTIIYPEQGFYLRKLHSNSQELFFTGDLKQSPTIAPIEPGFNLVGTIKADTALTLEELNLIQDFTGDTGMKPGAGPNNADTLIVYDANGGNHIYWYSSIVGYEGWHDFEYNLASNVSLAPGDAFFILRRKATAFDWTIPGE